MSFWRRALSEPNGQPSSKRLIGVGASALLCALYAAHTTVAIYIALRRNELPPTPDVTLGGIVAALAFGCLGLTTSEKWSPQARTEARVAEKRATVELQAISEEEP